MMAARHAVASRDLADPSGGRGVGESSEAGVEAGERLGVSALPCECPRQAREVAGRDRRPARPIRVVPVEVGEEAGQRADVLVVVPDDIHELARLAVPEEAEIALGDLPAGDVGVPPDAEQGGLDRRETGVCEPVPEQTPDDRQEVEMARVGRRACAGEPVAGDDERPVEAAPVVGHEPAPGRHVAGELVEERRLVRVVWQEQLELAEPATLPPPETDEEGEGAGGRRQARRLGVEAKQRRGRGRLAGQSRQAIAIERQERRGRLEPHEGAPIGADELAVEGRG